MSIRLNSQGVGDRNSYGFRKIGFVTIVALGIFLKRRGLFGHSSKSTGRMCLLTVMHVFPAILVRAGCCPLGAEPTVVFWNCALRDSQSVVLNARAHLSRESSFCP